MDLPQDSEVVAALKREVAALLLENQALKKRLRELEPKQDWGAFRDGTNY